MIRKSRIYRTRIKHLFKNFYPNLKSIWIKCKKNMKTVKIKL